MSHQITRQNMIMDINAVIKIKKLSSKDQNFMFLDIYEHMELAQY